MNILLTIKKKMINNLNDFIFFHFISYKYFYFKFSNKDEFNEYKIRFFIYLNKDFKNKCFCYLINIYFDLNLIKI